MSIYLTCCEHCQHGPEESADEHTVACDHGCNDAEVETDA